MSPCNMLGYDKEKNDEVAYIRGVERCTATFRSQLVLAYFVGIASRVRAIRLPGAGAEHGCAGRFRIECTGPSLQPLDARIRQA